MFLRLAPARFFLTFLGTCFVVFMTCARADAAAIQTMDGLIVRSSDELSADCAPTGDAVDIVAGATHRAPFANPIRIAAITLPESPEALEAVRESVRRVSAVFAPHPVEFVTLSSSELEEKIRKGEIDAFIASSGFFWRMTQFGAMSVATLISPQQPDPNRATAAAVLVRADDERIGHLSDLEGKRLGSTFETAFATYRIVLAEVARLGKDPEQFFAEKVFTGRTDNDEVVALLDDGKVDAVIVKSCWLETLPLERQKLYRVLDPKPGSLRCQHSTRAYPGVMTAVVMGAPTAVAHTIARSFLSYDQLPGGHRWAVSTDMRGVDEVYRLLRIEQYAYLRGRTWTGWFAEHWEVLAALFLLLTGAMMHGVRVSTLVRRRTLRLKAVMRQREKMQAQVQGLKENMENLNKLTVVGQLSSMIAHEISQPLAAIAYYCESQRDILAAENPNRALLEKSCDGIEKAVTRTRAIVDKVRSYNRGTAERSGAVPLNVVVKRILSTVNAVRFRRATLHVVCPANLFVRADALELELLLHNLLKNALEAACEAPKPHVAFKAFGNGKTVCIHICNSGLRLSAEAFAQLKTPFFTTKSKGVGLGIPIAAALVEASGGHLDFQQRLEGGLCAEITFVRANADDASETSVPDADDEQPSDKNKDDEDERLEKPSGVYADPHCGRR